MKSVRIQSYSGPHFPVFGLNTERYSLSLRIQSKCGKMRTRITPNKDTFYVLYVINEKFRKNDYIFFHRIEFICTGFSSVPLCLRNYIKKINRFIRQAFVNKCFVRNIASSPHMLVSVLWSKVLIIVPAVIEAAAYRCSSK